MTSTSTTPREADGAKRLGEVSIGRRFNGPEQSGNGGYSCGTLAAFLPEPAEVTLRLPPPLERSLQIIRPSAGGGRVEMRDGEALVAEGRPCEPLDLEPPVRPTYEQAVAAAALHPGRGARHALSDCFVCSPYREPPAGDGLGVCPGPLEGAENVGAAPFHPDASVASEADPEIVALEVVWAALDCPSYVPAMWDGTIALLGRLAVAREREIRVGERIAAVGWPLDRDGRKHHTASALIDEDGEIVARGRATWIELAG